jgi:hypothetical protein
MTAQPYDYNFAGEKPDIREVIPAGTKLQLRHTFTPGGYAPDGKMTNGGPLTKSKPTADNPNPDTLYLKSEFTVLRGPYKGRKFWSNLTVVGGQVDETGASKAGKITRQNIRLMIDSSKGLSSKDDSPAAAAKRVLPNGFPDLQNIIFVGTVKIEPAQGNYPEKNALGLILTIDNKLYPADANELDNPPKPAGAPTPAVLPAVPSWETSAQPVQVGQAASMTGQEILASLPVGGRVAPLTVQNPPSGVPAWAQ